MALGPQPNIVRHPRKKKQIEIVDNGWRDTKFSSQDWKVGSETGVNSIM